MFPDLASAARTAAAAKEVAEDNSDDEGEVPESATVLVDLLLELLHRPSAFVKGIAQTVFTGFANEIGEQAMDLLLDVSFFWTVLFLVVHRRKLNSTKHLTANSTGRD